VSNVNIQNSNGISFKVHIHDGKTPFPNDDIYYIVAKEGIFLKKRLELVESLVPVSKISTLESVKTSIKMHIPKIPIQLFSQAVSFFRYVYDLYSSESVILLFYNKSKQYYKLVVPQQTVSSAFCKYESKIHIPNYLRIGDIHSHANFAAFHSSVDKDDEQSFDGIHITVGNVQCNDVSISVSLVSNGSRYLVQVDEYIDKLHENNGKFKVETTYFPLEWLNQVSEIKTVLPYNIVSKVDGSSLVHLETVDFTSIPCLTCKYKDIKILIEEDELVCNDCQATFSLEECDGICPECGSVNINIGGT